MLKKVELGIQNYGYSEVVVSPGVNFVNIFCERFSYESALCTFSLVTFWRQKALSYKSIFGSFSLVTFGLATKFHTKNARKKC